MTKEKIVWKQFGPRIPNEFSKNYMKELPKKWSSEGSDDENSPRLYIRNQLDKLDLPISGGWGYYEGNCVVIDKNDPSVDSSKPFNGVQIEYQFIEKRIYAELIVFKPKEHKCSGIKWELLSQKCEVIDGKTYDFLEFKVSYFNSEDWDYLKKDWEDNDGFKDNPSGLKSHNEERAKRLSLYKGNFCFDITSFYDLTEGENKTLGSYRPEKEGTIFPRR